MNNPLDPNSLLNKEIGEPTQTAEDINVPRKKLKAPCPQCEEKDPNIKNLSNGTCGVCGGKGYIVWKPIGKLVETKTVIKENLTTKTKMKNPNPTQKKIDKVRVFKCSNCKCSFRATGYPTLCNTCYLEGIKYNKTQTVEKKILKLIQNDVAGEVWYESRGCENLLIKCLGKLKVDLVKLFQSEIKANNEKVLEIIDKMWIKKEKDKDGHDVGWNSALAELEVRLKLKL